MHVGVRVGVRGCARARARGCARVRVRAFERASALLTLSLNDVLAFTNRLLGFHKRMAGR